MKDVTRETRLGLIGACLMAAFLLNACGKLTPTGLCSSFYREGVTFQLRLGESTEQKKQVFSLDLNGSVFPKFVVTGTITSETDATKIRSLPCEPQWSIEPEGSVSVERNAEAIATGEYILKPNKLAGVAKVTGLVTGEGETAKDFLWVIVTNEREPNNGPAGAHVLTEKTTGALSQPLDTDWFFIRVPANKAYQISLELFPNLNETKLSGTLCRITGSSAIQATRFPSLVNDDDLDCTVHKDINTTYFNDTEAELLVFVKIVIEGDADPVTNPGAYQLEPFIFDSPVNFTSAR